MPGDILPSALEFRAISLEENAAGAPVNLHVPKRRFAVLRGKAGSGKERLLRMAGLLENPPAGEVLIAGQAVQELDEAARAELRRRHVGYLFSAPFLLPAFTVLENVVMPMFKVLDSGPSEARQRAEELLAFAKVTAHEQERAGDLAHFSQRCVALARALATEPKLLLVEDLDGDVAPEQAAELSRLLRGACQRWPITVLASASPAWTAATGDLVFDVLKGEVFPAAEPQPRS